MDYFLHIIDHRQQFIEFTLAWYYGLIQTVTKAKAARQCDAHAAILRGIQVKLL